MAVIETPPTITAPAALAQGYDEAYAEPGKPRPHYRELIDALEDRDLTALGARVDRDLAQRGVAFGGGEHPHPFAVDPVPRVLTGAEWGVLAEGLEQRARALQAFVLDVYGERAIVAAQRIPEAAIETCSHYVRELTGGMPGESLPLVAGFDVVRSPDGEFLVLEDNLRTPSGFAYAAAAREALDTYLPLLPERREVSRAAFDLLARTLRAADPSGRGDPSIVVLSDGPANSAWYEHARVARMLDLPLVTLGDLDHRDGRLRFRLAGAASRPVDVVYRRTDEDRLRDERARLTPVAGALLEPWRRGRLGLVNPFGAGVADDKLIHAYVEEMVRFYLAQEPLLRSVPTLDLGDPRTRDEVFAEIGDFVIKPRNGLGGSGVVVCKHATRADRESVAREVAALPGDHVAQRTISLSHHPTVCGGRLAPRHVDLRAFVFATADGADALPGGLSRFASEAGALVVNSSHGGGGKDTWVLT